MGSSSGFLGNINPEDFIKKIRKAEKQSTSAEFNGKINNIISNLLVSFNDRPIEEIKIHLGVIKNAIVSEIESAIDLMYGGSVSKHTYVDGLSDIDSLAIINNTELADENPHEVLDFFYKVLKHRLPKTEIKKGRLAITLNFSDGIQIQILPALRTKTGLKIAAPNGDNNWSSIVKPNKFAEKLRDINNDNNQKVIPVIKLAKSIISNLPEKRQITGYHTESLAIEAFEKYNGSLYPKDMIKHFFEISSKRILTYMKDNSNQSVHVDDYLGSNNSVQRQIVSDSFAQVARKMNNADGVQRIDLWESIFK